MATASRDLRTGRSIWERHRTPGVAHRPLRRDLDTDVLVIGAGITGAMVADALTGAGLKVVIVDRRGPAKGSTAASTALVQYEIDKPLSLLTRKIGKPRAVQAWRRARLAVDALGARLRELNVPDVERRDSLYLAGNLLDRDGLERERNARRAAGLACRLLGRTELRELGIARNAALLGYDNFVVDPRKATFALLNAALAHKARIFAPVDVADVEATRAGVTAITADGRRIHCRHLVFASGYELPHHVPRRGHKINSTWAIATAPQKRRLWPGQCMIWEAAEPYLYVRTTSDGRVICGGEDEEFSDEDARDALLECKTKVLARKLRKLLPGIDNAVDFAWTGTFGETATGLPIIGEVPGLPHCWVALGYGGNGITYARVAADVICGALTGHPDVDADLYDFPRPE